MAAKPKLSRLRIYPVKSLGGVELQEWELDRFGLRLDRRWMVVDGQGRFMTQREHPAMAQVEVELRDDTLVLDAPHQPALELPLEPESGPTEPVVIWGDTVAAQPVSDDANRWLGQWLRTSCRLVYLPESSMRSVDPEHDPGQTGLAFADGFPLLLVGAESVADLNGRLASPVRVECFRPNLVIEGTEGPYDEDAWRRIEIGGIEIHVVTPCSRCAITTIDQGTGQRAKEPLATLATYRQRDGKVYFGQNAVHAMGGRLRVGEKVKVLERGQAPALGSGPAPAGAEPARSEPARSEPAKSEPAPAAPAEVRVIRMPAGGKAKPAAKAASKEPTPAAAAAEPKRDRPAPRDERKQAPAEPAPAAATPVEIRSDAAPDVERVARLLSAAAVAEGKEALERLAAACAAAPVLLTAWRGDELVGLLRGWTDEVRDGFIADVAVHPDLHGEGVAEKLVRQLLALYANVRWVLRASPGSAYLGSALGWQHVGSGWYVAPK